VKSRELKYSIAVLMFLLAYYLFSGKWAGKVSSSRNPASIQKVFDYSYLEGESLITAAKERLGNSVEIAFSDDKSETLITVGNFVLPTGNNEKDFACGVYDKVTLVFEAEGVAVGGSKPKLIIESKCEVASNINALVPIRIPVSKIRSAKPVETELKFYDSKEPLSIKLQNAPGAWPSHWFLTSIKLTHTQYTSRILNVENFNQAISMNW